jgi:hypothetical protein
MAGKTAVVFSCAHSDPSVSNERFDWLGELIWDVKPDYVVDLGDGADMRSLNSFDSAKAPKNFVSQSYQADIECYNEAMDRMRIKFKANKRKRPAYYGFEGNHETRIRRAIGMDPRIEGEKYGISFKHLGTDTWFDEYHEYEHDAPAIHDYDGVSYAHFFTNGYRPMSGVNHAAGILAKRFGSATCGHSHKRDMKIRDDVHPYGAIGLVAGCYKGAPEGWAGQMNKEWWSGVIIKREIENGMYEPEFVSQERMKATYGKK